MAYATRHFVASENRTLWVVHGSKVTRLLGQVNGARLPSLS